MRRGSVQRIVEANGVELCTEPFGDPADPPILLVMGIGGSMLWWEEGFCRMLADRGRHVIRYDHRDTGRSVTYEPGRPEYTGADLTADAVGVFSPRAPAIGAGPGPGITSPVGVRCVPPSVARLSDILSVVVTGMLCRVSAR